MIWILLGALSIWSLIFIWLDIQIKDSNHGGSAVIEQVSNLDIVICMRNESENIHACLDSIDKQQWLPTQTRVILVDDFSADDSLKKALNYEPDNFQLFVERLKEGEGKKDALRHALSLTKSKYIYFTDADCRLGPTALLTLFNGLIQKNASAIAGPVLFKYDDGLSKILAAENLNNQCVAEAFIGFQKPIMANGANLLISEEVKDVYIDTLNAPSASGDDVFFAQRLGAKMHVLMNSYSAVITKPHTELFELIQQRLRWASKTTKYRSNLAKGFAALVFAVNTVFALSLIFIPFITGGFWIFLIFFVKTIVEFGFHRKWFQKFGFQHDPVTGVVLSLVYPIYVLLIGLLATIRIPYRWKGRKWKG